MDEEILETVVPDVPGKDLRVPESTIKGFGKKIKELEATVVRLSEDGKAKDLFIITIAKSNIVLKLQYDMKITADELDFLKKNCTEK